MASNVTPSMPGAPLFFLAIAYACLQRFHLADVNVQPPEAPRRFSLRLDVYPPPQVLQTAGRICHLVLAFHVVGGVATQQGPFAPPALPGFIATTDPSATLSPSAHFPGSPVIGPTLLRRFRAGARRASPVAWLVLVTVPSLPPRRSGSAASVRFRLSMLPSPFGCGLGLRGHSLSRPHPRSLSLRPGDSHLPYGRSVDRLQSHRFPSSLLSKLRGF